MVQCASHFPTFSPLWDMLSWSEEDLREANFNTPTMGSQNPKILFFFKLILER